MVSEKISMQLCLNKLLGSVKILYYFLCVVTSSNVHITYISLEFWRVVLRNLQTFFANSLQTVLVENFTFQVDGPLY